MSTQLELPLAPPRAPPRQQPVIDRLRAVLKRSGINWHYRHSSGSVLLRPLLVARTGWQPMCGYFGCGSFTFERVAGYCEREPFTREEREAWAWWREREYRPAVNELWGPP